MIFGCRCNVMSALVFCNKVSNYYNNRIRYICVLFRIEQAMKNLPTFKYVDNKFGNESSLMKDWENLLNTDSINRTNVGEFGEIVDSLMKGHKNMDDLGKPCDEGFGTGNMMCKIGYNYQKLKIREYKNRVNDRKNLPVYQLRSMDNPEVTFNTLKYVPTMIYILDPLANYKDNELIKNPESTSTQGGDSEPAPPEKFPFTMHNALPSDSTAYRGVTNVNNTTSQTPINLIEKLSTEMYSQFIIEHRPVQTERTDLLWIIIPMKIFVKYDEDEDNIAGTGDGTGAGTDAGEREKPIYGGEPTSSFELALKWMLQRWVDKINPSSPEKMSRSYLQEDTYESPVELKDVIPNLPTMSPYLYIKHYGNGKLHHVVHFKERHIKTSGVNYNVGILRGLSAVYPLKSESVISSRRRYREHVYFQEGELDDDLDVEVFNSDGENLVKNKQGVMRSRKGLNMTCKPVKIGGNKYNDDYKYELVSGEIKRQTDDWKDKYKHKYFSGQGRNFGIALVILIMMVLLVVVGSFFMTRSTMKAVSFPN